MAARVELREITNEEGNRLLRIVRRDSGSVVTWRRAQIVLLSAQRMSPAKISEVVFTDPDTVREVIHNFNRDGFDALYPRYAGGRPPTFTLPQRREIKKIALSIPTDLGRPFATWSLAKLADYLVAEGVVTDISHEGLRQLLREEGVSFQAVRTWKRSNDPSFEAKKNRILELYEAADAGEAVVICLDEFGPLNLQPQPGGKAWAPLKKPRRIRATYTRPHGVRHMLGAYDVTHDRLYGHVKKRKTRVEFLAFCRYVRSLHPAGGEAALHPRQLQPPPRRRRSKLGLRQQRRARLHAALRLLAQPHRGPVQSASLLHPRRHRPSRPRHPGPSHPPLHRLAQLQRRRREATGGRQHGKRCLTHH